MSGPCSVLAMGELLQKSSDAPWAGADAGLTPREHAAADDHADDEPGQLLAESRGTVKLSPSLSQQVSDLR